MMQGLTITKEVHFRSAKRGRKVMKEGSVTQEPDLGRTPRISRLIGACQRV